MAEELVMAHKALGGTAPRQVIANINDLYCLQARRNKRRITGQIKHAALFNLEINVIQMRRIAQDLSSYE
jgi:hypothetical protein